VAEVDDVVVRRPVARWGEPAQAGTAVVPDQDVAAVETPVDDPHVVQVAEGGG
jgi:hypothetical protein